MSNLEEQADEIEALQAIYPDDFEIIEHPSKYRIKLSPDNEKENHVIIWLVCDIPSDYPLVTPEFSVEVIKGISKRQCEEILDIANKHAVDSIGMPSVFAVAGAVREWLVDNNIPGQDGSMYADMMRRMTQKDVVEKKKEIKAAVAMAADRELSKGVDDEEEQDRIRKRQAGTMVTVESFMKWKEAFESEQRALFGDKEKETDGDKPTGKQLFLSNRAGLEELLLAAAEAEESAGGAVAVSEDLFKGDELPDEFEEYDSAADDSDYVAGEEEEEFEEEDFEDEDDDEEES